MSESDFNEVQPAGKVDFVEHNKEVVELMSKRKMRYGTHLQRTRLLKMHREPESFAQQRVLGNIDKYEMERNYKAEEPNF